MKFSEVTLADIENYINNCNDDDNMISADYEESNTNILRICRFDGLIDSDVTVFKVEADREGHLSVVTDWSTMSLCNWLEDVDDVEDEDDDISMDKVTEVIMFYAKVGICEERDFLKRQVDFIDGFCEYHKLKRRSITTLSGITFE